MAVIIPQDQLQWSRIVLWVVVIIALIVIVWAIWKYIYRPYREGTLGNSNTVKCTAKPDSPTGLTAKIQTNNRAYVSWTATANTDSYRLYVGNTAGFATIDAERAIDAKSDNIIVLNLSPKTYYFKVVAINTCGTSNNSSEVSITITQWPDIFKLCKRDSPEICINFEGDGDPVRMSNQCTNNECQLTYADLQKFKRYNTDLCLASEDIIGPDVETPLTSKSCASAGTWNMNISTGRISNGAGLCFGGNSVPDTAAYNTDCAIISNPDDARYAWEVVALTN